ncbi:MAG: nucleoside-diphosphate kinase, partial [Pisciglobus halotolerans]|nr:nucleoside-diphosphate kinase [Pisciglobus halotolerans]
NNLKVVEMKMVDVPRKTAEEHYAEHKQKPFFKSLVSYLTRSPIVALILEGENVIERVRGLNGATNPEEAGDNTIRSLYGIQLSENTVHASDSSESAKREMAIWFN